MKNNKIENDPLSIEQALLVFGSKPNVVALVKPLTKQLTKMNPAIILQDPREWANLSDVLLMRGLPDNARLDFDLAAKQFNERIKKAAAGNPNPPKELTEGEYRKGAVAATRKRLQEAQAELIQTNDPAKIVAITGKRDEALKILNKYGWTEQAMKREKKAKKPAKSGAKGPPAQTTGKQLDNPEANQPVSSPVKMAETALQTTPASVPVIPSNPPNTVPVEPKPEIAEIDLKSGMAGGETTLATPAIIKASETPAKERIYVKGFGKPHEAALLKIGGIYDRPQKTWHFPDQSSADEAARIMTTK
jgi:hypothetical protein